MANHRTTNTEWAARNRQALTTRHSHEDVLHDREFELLLEAFGDLPAPRDFEAQFIYLLGGRLGLRAGEIAPFPYLLTGLVSQTDPYPAARTVQRWLLPAPGPPRSRLP